MQSVASNEQDTIAYRNMMCCSCDGQVFYTYVANIDSFTLFDRFILRTF